MMRQILLGSAVALVLVVLGAYLVSSVAQVIGHDVSFLEEAPGVIGESCVPRSQWGVGAYILGDEEQIWICNSSEVWELIATVTFEDGVLDDQAVCRYESSDNQIDCESEHVTIETDGELSAHHDLRVRDEIKEVFLGGPFYSPYLNVELDRGATKGPFDEGAGDFANYDIMTDAGSLYAVHLGAGEDYMRFDPTSDATIFDKSFNATSGGSFSGDVNMSTDFFAVSVDVSLSAASTGACPSGTSIITQSVNVTTITASSAENVILPTCGALGVAPLGTTIRIRNSDAADTATICPPSGGNLGAGTNTGVEIQPGQIGYFHCYDSDEYDYFFGPEASAVYHGDGSDSTRDTGTEVCDALGLTCDTTFILGSAGSTSEKSWAFFSPTGSSGTFYWGGYYDWASTDNDFNPSVNLGTSQVSYAAHVSFICAAGGSGGTDTVVRIAGTSITDTATRTAGDSQDITMDDAGAAGAYYESSKKWIGLVAITKQSGPDLLCNYGWSKYWDNSNSDFTVTGLEATWLGGATETGANIELQHHKDTGWTYNAGSTPTEPTPIAALQTDHVNEYTLLNNTNGAWKRTNLSQAVDGDGNEGTILKITTTANKAFQLGNFIMTISTTGGEVACGTSHDSSDSFLALCSY